MLKLIEKVLIFWADTARKGGLALVILFAALTAAAGFYAAKNLKVNTDTSAMLSPDLDFQVRAKELREAFPDLKNDVAVIIRAPTLDEAEAFTAALRTRALNRPDQFASVYAPSADPFFRDNGLLYLDTDELERRLSQMSKASGLIETLIQAPTAGQLFATLADNDELAEKSDLGKDTLDRIYGELADVIEASAEGNDRPFSWLGALSTDEPEVVHTRLVYVTPKLDFTRLQPAKPAITELKTEIAGLEEQFNDRIETFITGDPALRADELAAVTSGIEISFLISFLSVGVLLLICYRSIALAVTTLTSLVATIVFTAAFAAVAIGELNLVSVAFTVLLVGLGLDFAIHLILHLQERRAGGEDLAHSLKGSVHEVGPALVLAALTTTLGFFAFIPTKFDGIAQLGIIAGVGVIVALIVSLTFIPAALGAIGGGRTFNRKKSGAAQSPFARLALPVAFATVALGAASLFLLPKARFDADPMSLRDPASQSVVGFNLLFDDKDTIPYRVSVLASNEAETAAAVDKAKSIAEVGGVRSLLSFIPDNQDDKLDLIEFAAGSLVFALDIEEDRSAAPASRDGAGKLAARLEAAHAEGTPGRRLAKALSQASDETLSRAERNIFAYWPALVERLRAQFNADHVGIDTLPQNLSKRYLSADGKWRVDILPATDVREPKSLSAFVKAVETEFPAIAGGAIQSEKAGEVISGAMLQATLIALAVISLFLIALLRRIDEVLLMLFPLALAGVLTAAAGVLLDIPFNYANVIVLPLLMGIGIDSGIHLVMRQRQLDVGENIYGASTPRAVLFSALTTVASFGSLMLSPHRGTASMGELLSIAIGFTLLCTLIVLPVAFRLFEGRKLG